MANNSINLASLTQYVDQLSSDLIKESVIKGKTIDLINTQVGIKFSEALNIMTSDLKVAAGGCGTISPTGSVSLAQRNIQVCPIKVEEQICLNELEQYWLGQSMKAGSYNEDAPDVFNRTYVADKVDKIQDLIERYIWQGDTSNNYSNGLSLCTGFLSILQYTSATSSVVSSGSTFSGALTSTTAIAVVDSIIGSIPSAIIQKDNIKIFMSYANFFTYTRAWRDRSGGAGAFHYSVDEAKGFKFMVPGTNVEVIATSGLVNRTQIVCTTTDNLYFGTDLVSDKDTFMTWYEKKEDVVYFRAKFKIGAQIAYPQYVVLYV